MKINIAIVHTVCDLLDGEPRADVFCCADQLCETDQAMIDGMRFEYPASSSENFRGCPQRRLTVASVKRLSGVGQPGLSAWPLSGAYRAWTQNRVWSGSCRRFNRDAEGLLLGKNGQLEIRGFSAAWHALANSSPWTASVPRTRGTWAIW
jgi:hypothetical protein